MASLPTLAWEIEGVGTFKFEPLTEKVFVMHGPKESPNWINMGFINNPSFIESKNGIIMIDPSGTYQAGLKILEEVAKITPKPILAVFNTHIHADHWFANHAIKEAYPKVTIYGHSKMITQAKGEKGRYWLSLMSKLTEGRSDGTKIIPPDQAVDEGEILIIDGQSFRIHQQGIAHTDTDILIEHIESKTIFLGDNSFNHRFGQFDDSSNMHGNIASLQYVKTLNLVHFVPGHGDSGSASIALIPFLNYLEKIQKGVALGFEEGLEDYEIKEKLLPEFTQYAQWSGFDENFGKHINKMYLEHEELDMATE